MLCKCEICGENFTMRPSILRRGGGRYCSKKCFGAAHALPEGHASRNVVFGKYRTRATERGHSWELSLEEFCRLTRQKCHYCGLPPETVFLKKECRGSFVYNGIDRKDNKVGYTSDNSVPCCKMCNFAKRDFSYDTFVKWLRRIRTTTKTTVGW